MDIRKMENNLGITTNDFENICRTCLSREGLRPMYEEYLVEMLMSCTVVKVAENDGLPAKICNNCINEINKAFSFAKLCETSDKILRKCVIKLETEEANNSSHSEKVEATIKTEEDIKPEIIYRTVKEVLSEYECMQEVKQEKDVKMEFEENIELNTKLEIECDETYDDPVDECYEEEDDDEVQDEKYSDSPGFRNKRRCTNSSIVEKNSKDVDPGNYDVESCVEDDNQDKIINKLSINDDESIKKYNNSRSRPKRSCTISQIEENSSKGDDSETYEDPADESYEEEDDDADQDEMYLEKSDNPGSRLKRKTTRPQIKEGSTKHKLGQHKHNRHSKSNNQINPSQRGIQTGENLYTCEVCSKSFSQNLGLKTHMRIHTSEKPYICNICSKAFSRSSKLERHMRIHTGKKPYTCEVCNKGFSRNINLKTHMRIHTGEKPYTCEVCNKSFSRNINLKSHMRIHTGEKPYTCRVCSKGFSQDSHLKRHMRIHTGEKPYTCEVCCKDFSRNQHLKSHMRIHSRGDVLSL